MILKKVMRGLFVFATCWSGSQSLIAETKQGAPSHKPEQITIGFIPGDSPEDLKAGAQRLATKIQERMGVPTNVYISKNYQGLIDAMNAKKVDYAFFGAMSFVFAEKQAGAKVLMKKVWSSPFYYSTIVVKKSSKINKVEDLKGKKFAYIDERSTSGYLYPKVLFQQKHIDPDTFFKKTWMTGNHKASVEAVLNGEADAAAVFADDDKAKESAWNRFFPARANELKAIWISEPIPNDPFCVRQDFYDQYPFFTHNLMTSLVDFKEETLGTEFQKAMGFAELRMATSKQYDPVRKMVRLLNLRLDP